MDARPGKKRKKGGKLVNALLILLLLAGVFVMIYPWLSDYVNRLHQGRAIEAYDDTVSDFDPDAIADLWRAAEEYNRRLLTKPDRYHFSVADEAEYRSILNVTDTGIMSYVEIPKLQISLPIYHGLDESSLQIAVGHIPGTSVPVGGPSTHVVIAGHRGLPSAKLFTEIDRMEVGDEFRIQTLGVTLTYRVDQIVTVLPDEIEEIEIEDGKDYVTLVTCTPYGVNTHRLLVRGARVS